jgi:MoCo/4Fe-4S cofactor protein with predicted Tat translocation signal
MDLPKEKKYWASLAQYNNDPEFLAQARGEFTESPLKKSSEEIDGIGGIARRDFMKLMAASSALATTACYSQPAHKILPYVNQPEEVTFGIANYYASTCGECSASCGVLVKTREGRPIKLEGNPDHPMNKGALCSAGQASILNLYDPDRLREPVSVTRGSGATSTLNWESIDQKISAKLKEAHSGAGQVRILSRTINSPSTLKLTKEFLANFKKGAHVVYEPFSAQAITQAQELNYGGEKLLPRYRFDKADYIVSIDADFLGAWLSPVEFTKQFTAKRKLSKKTDSMSKLVSFESVMTLTGSNSDERHAILASQAAYVALALAYELNVNLKVGGDNSLSESLSPYSPDKVSATTGVPVEVLRRVAKELSEHKGKSLVVAGSTHAQTASALTLQMTVNLLNSILSNDGVTVDYSTSPSNQNLGSYADLIRLVKDMNEGLVDVLFVHDLNPLYTLPAKLGFADAVKKVGLVVSFGDRADESARIYDFICPDSHYLENWGDAEPQKNLFSLLQPTIRPLYNTRSFQDSLLSFAKLSAIKVGAAADWHEYLQNNWKDTIYKKFGKSVDFISFWESALRDGVIDGVRHLGQRDNTSKARNFKAQSLSNHLSNEKSAKSTVPDFELALYSTVAHGDGKNGNNPWLMELPDPISRVAWDNFASVSPDTAEKFHLVDGDMVRITTGTQTLELPAHVQPGLHNKTIAVMFGLGREEVGRVGNKVGKNIFQLTQAIQSSGDTFQLSGLPATFKKTGAKYILACAQEHHSMEGRAIVKEADLKEFSKTAFAGNEEKEELTTLWPKHNYDGYRWGMSIDLNSCTGCNACVVACQSENNIPTVGKDGVNRGRIMHWMRIDRYYSGTPDKPEVVHLPMLCQHCENAPCETVCPVLATVHDNEGINQQIYNRCVGTRYCSNNCPYKVRRFNWFDYNYREAAYGPKYPLNLQQNPEVTVRSRGVMEKCSFCIQRISDAKNKARDLNREVKDGELKTACQQSCPGDAIEFGNMNDAQSLVRKNAEHPRGYHVLEELNVKPSITYLTKIRNTEHV